MNKVKSWILYIAIAVLGVITIRNLLMWKKREGSPIGLSYTEAVVDQKTIDFKKKRYKSPVIGSFVISNTGTSNLIIGDVKSDCHCTVPQWSREPVLPGKSTTINVHYDSTSLGFFYRTIRVNMNIKSSPMVLAIKGEVIP